MLKIPQYNVYKFNTFKLFTKEENELYNDYSASKSEDRIEKRNLLDEKIASFEGIREINEKVLTIKNQVSLFDSDMIRLFKTEETKERSLIEDVIIITVEHDEIFNQIMDNGIICMGKKFLFYTASAGQVREKSLVFMSEEALKIYEYKLMGGLTIEEINGNGGVNTGKFLSYKALTMSSSIQVEVPYDRIIVVEDFITNISDKVEYIDTNNPELPITIEEMLIEVNHCDGCGIILPNKLEGIIGNCQIRDKWIKGALAEFEFDKFALNVAENTKVIDIYKTAHDIIEEDIWIILTRSQFKMADHYKDWKTFKDKMKETNSKLCICNVENPPQDEKELSYQYLQTLYIEQNDEDTIKNLCQPTIDKVKRLHKNQEEMLSALGATEENENLKPLQEALLIYPQLLQDKHVQKEIKKIVKSYRDNALGGRILGKGYYSYIFPDLYAFCQQLFIKDIGVPEGLIPKGYVYNSFHKDDDIKRVDLLRSPHLYCSEHCVRNLVKTKECKEWFRGHATYVSTHDLAQLQMKNDVDGDICYVSTSEDIISHVRTECLPLYYIMGKAPKNEINIENIKKSLILSFESNEIGEISNAITKEFAKAEEQIDFDLIRRLQCLNNFVIDYPKTGEIIKLPPADAEKYDKLKDSNLPHFFKWAKKKKKVNETGNGVVDRISKYIEEHTRYIKFKCFKEPEKKFNYAMLTSGIEVRRDEKVYTELQNLMFKADKDIAYLTRKLNKLKKEDELFKTKFDITYQYYREQMINLFNGYENMQKLVDYFIDIEYCQVYTQNKKKTLLWNCFGWEILKNLKRNLKSDRELKARVRFAYGNKEKTKQYEEIMPRLEVVMQPASIDISRSDIDQVNKLKKNERILLYVIICLCKLPLYNNKLSIYKNKDKKFNINKLNRLANISNAWDVLNRLSDKKYITIKKEKQKNIISLVESNNDVKAFTVDNVWKPLVSLAKYDGKAIGTCEICGEEFIKIGNSKTCSNRCSKEITKRTKEKIYQNKKNNIDNDNAKAV